MKEFKDASGENPFCEIYECAKRILTVLNFNTDAERILSVINYMKSNTINSMKTDLLNVILVIKLGLIRNGKCCMSHKLPDSVVKATGTLQAYKGSIETSCSTVESTPSLTTTIEMGSEEEDDGHFNF